MVLVKILTFSFSLFFLKKGLNILFAYLQERKQPLLDYKSEILKKSKNWDFLKGFKGAMSRNSAKLGNYKMPVKLRET